MGLTADIKIGTNFYPRSPCGERRRRNTAGNRAICISIHALLAESDPIKFNDFQQLIISIHALLAESEAKVHKTVGHFCTYETNFMGIASSY